MPGFPRRPAMIIRSAAAAFLALALLLVARPAVAAAPGITRIDAANLAADGRTPFSFSGYMNGEAFQDAITSFNGWEYAVYWDAGGHVNVARRDLSGGGWADVTLTDYTTTSTDSHNVISIGIDHADGTIHLAFDMHNTRLNYRRSIAGLASDPAGYAWVPSDFGAVQHSITSSDSTSLTYPEFINVPDGRLQMAIRTGAAGAGNEVLYEYASGTWSYLGEFIDGQNTRNAYLFGIEYRGDTLYTAWNWRESGTTGASTNHDLMYAYSTDYGRTWRNNAGTLVATTGTSFIVESTPGITVWSIPQNRGYQNMESMTVDSLGQVHVLASHLPANAPDQSDWATARNSAVLVHYYRDTAGGWHQSYTSFLEGQSRSQIGVDSQDNLYLVVPDAVSTDGDYLKVRIITASAASGWSDWTVRYTSTSGQVLCDPLIDQPRLTSANVLTFYYVEYGGSRIDYQDWKVNV